MGGGGRPASALPLLTARNLKKQTAGRNAKNKLPLKNSRLRDSARGRFSTNIPHAVIHTHRGWTKNGNREVLSANREALSVNREAFSVSRKGFSVSGEGFSKPVFAGFNPGLTTN
jgi:hypothetical protein